MTWWLWVIVGVIVYVIILLIGYMLLKSASDGDKREGRK